MGQLTRRTEFRVPQGGALRPDSPVTPEGAREVLMRLPNLDELEGFGVFGSPGGQQGSGFDPRRSDTDVFLVLKEPFATDGNADVWVRRVMDALSREFGRQVDVLTFTLRALSNVPGWHAIRMASDCPVLYDPEGKEADLFRRIVEAARSAGLAQEWRGSRRVWVKQDLVLGERIVVEVSDHDG